MLNNFLNTHPQLMTRLSRAVILLSLGFQAGQAASALTQPASALPDSVDVTPSKKTSSTTTPSRYQILSGAVSASGKVKSGIDTTNTQKPSPTTMAISTGPGGIALGAGSLAGLQQTGTTQLMISPSYPTTQWSGPDGNYPPTCLSNPLIINAPLTAPSGILSTVLNPGAVIRINLTTAAATAAIGATGTTGGTIGGTIGSAFPLVFKPVLIFPLY